MIAVGFFCFALALAFTFVVIYDLYEKLRECEKTIAQLQTTIADARLIESVLNSKNGAETAKEQPQKRAGRRRRNRRSRRSKGTSVVCYPIPA